MCRLRGSDGGLAGRLPGDPVAHELLQIRLSVAYFVLVPEPHHPRGVAVAFQPGVIAWDLRPGVKQQADEPLGWVEAGDGPRT